MFSKFNIGIDLGSSNILVHCKEKGIIINEPSIIAIHSDSNELMAVGSEAKRMVGKTPENLRVVSPIRDGVIADFTLTAMLLKHVMAKAANILGMTYRKPNVMICAPSTSTSVEQRAIIDAVKSCGAKQVELVEQPVAAAIGAGMSVEEPIANVVVDIGGGTTEVAIISFGGIVSSELIKIGGTKLDQNIIQYVRKAYNVLIGERTAENIKINIGYAPGNHVEEMYEVRGRDLLSGLPKNITLHSKEIQHVLKEDLGHILELIRSTLEECPPELSGDIVDRGVILTGGGALLNGITEWLNSQIFVPVHLSPSPLESVALGTGKMDSKFERVPWYKGM